MANLQVLVDSQVFRLQNTGGISRYFTELITALRSRPDLAVDVTLPLRSSTNQHLVDAGLTRRLGPGSSHRESDLIRKVARRISPNLPRDWRNYDLIHHSYYLPEVLAASPGATRVVTVHDMIPETHPEFSQGQTPHAAKDRYVAEAAVIICVSDFTRSELLRVWGPREQPVVVIPEAAGPEFHPHGPAWGSGDPYLLFVGQRAGYKDFACLVAALAELGATDPELRLIAVGGGRFTAAEQELFVRHGVATRVSQHVPDANELAAMYRGAAAFVYPSRVEGFGLPTLEALACGAPAVLSDIAVFHEVAGNAADYFHPGDPGALSAAVTRVLNRDRQSGEWSGAVQARVERAARFSWERTAELTAHAYRRALAEEEPSDDR